VSETASTPPDPGSRRFRNAVVGCLVACGVLGLLATATCVGFVVWVRRPGTMIDPARLVGEDTRGVVAWTLRLDDPGTRAFVESMLERAEQERRSQTSVLPAPLGELLGAYGGRRDRTNVEQLFPLTVSWTSHGEPGSEPLDLLAVSVERLGNRVVVADWFLALVVSRSADLDVVRHGGQRIYVLRNGAAFFLRSGDVLVASSLPTARRAAERLAGPSGGAGAGAVTRLLEEVPADAALRDAVAGPETDRLLAVLTGGPMPRVDAAACPQGALVAGGLTGASGARATVTVLCDDATWIAERGPELVRAIGSGPLAGTRVELAPDTPAGALVVDLEVDDLTGLVERLFETPVVAE